MLRTLLESNAPSQRRRAGAIASIAIHTLLIAGAIVATASAKGGNAHVAGDRPTIHIGPLPRPGPTDPPAGSGRRVTGRETPDLPPPPGVSFDFDAEAVVPNIDVTGGPTALDTPIGPGGVESIGPSGGGPGGVLGDEPRTLAHVDRPAAMLAPPRPRYPDQLRAAGVSGRVVVRLVVDTAGRVESGTVTVRESSHDLFARAVLTVLPSLRFAPAEAGGRKVRMLVDLPFEFRLNE